MPGEVRSAHDLAEGGLLVALAECAIGGAKQLGATVNLDASDARLDALLFGESQSRALITTSADKAAAVLALFASHGVPARQIGSVGGTALVVGAGPHQLKWDVAELHRAWDTAFDAYLS